MKLLTQELRNQLISNFRKQSEAQKNGDSIDFKPVAKLFTPDSAATWLLTELDPDSNLAFGLCDLGLGFPELGYVSLDELSTVKGKLGLPIERDLFFEADKPLSKYHEKALSDGGVYA